MQDSARVPKAAVDVPPTANIRARERQAERARDVEEEPGLLTPRSLIFGLVVLAIGIGGGRKLIQAWRTRRALDRADEGEASAAEIEALPAHGRAALPALYRLLEGGTDAARRSAAGEALATLWARDELVAEEERAIVTRGYAVDWTARRTYPRGLRRPIPIRVAYGVPFLGSSDRCVRADQLEWSVRLKGTHRADLEQFTAWTPGAGQLNVEIFPDDFAGQGPHTLVLEPRVRTRGLSSAWEHTLPHVPFRFELDPRLDVSALLATHDAARAARMVDGIRLRVVAPTDADAQTYQALTDQFALRGTLALEVDPLPHDLAHHLAIEIEGQSAEVPAGLVVAAQPVEERLERSTTGEAGAAHPRIYPVTLAKESRPIAIERPGDVRVRAVLRPDAQLGWLDPAIRSIWPGEIVTEWVGAELVRR